MTEEEWLTCDCAYSMCNYAWANMRGREQNPQKWNLILCALCRRVWTHLTEPGRELLMLFEQYIESPTIEKDNELQEAIRLTDRVVERAEDVAVILTAFDEWGKYEEDIICLSAGHSSGQHDEPGRYEGEDAREHHRHELAAETAVFRDILGNPFRPVSFSLDWRTDTAVTLARQMYDSRDFSAMPILADALQDAGCDNEDILNHCRDTRTPHARGCWVVDLILGK